MLFGVLFVDDNFAVTGEFNDNNETGTFLFGDDLTMMLLVVFEAPVAKEGEVFCLVLAEVGVLGCCWRFD